MVGFALLYAHGAFRVPDDLFLDDQEPANAGFLSFLGGDASSAAAPAGVAHVFECWVFKYSDSDTDLVDLFDSDGEDEDG
ncbi:hypothetical protein D5086_012769 [Populus alba]|uniref:Uncharacterized protein n=1 Tax=Populus alba TaxID=43335 RepID=A0ACC4C4Y3_POPAL